MNGIFSKTDKKQLIITLIVGVFVVYVAGYILIFDFLVPNEKKANTVNLTTEEKFALVNYVPIVIDSFDYEGAYTNTRKTIDNINPAAILNVAYTEIAKVNSNLIQLSTVEYNNFKDTYCQTIDNNCFVISQSIMQKYIKNIFNKADYQLVDFKINGSENSECIFKNKNYMCHTVNGTNNLNNKKASSLVLFKTDKDRVYIYEKAAFLKGFSKKFNNGEYTYDIKDIYKYSSEESKYIISSDYSKVTNEGNIDELILNEFADQMQLFKHTFEQNADGKFYWVSTEPVAATEY